MDATQDEAADYHIAVHTDPDTLDETEWNALLLAQARPTPFMTLAYLRALHHSGSAVAATGWSARWLTLRRQGQLVAATVVYEKTHSYGEYVFDWAWAEAYGRHGLAYYPKLLTAVPFTPVPGSRLLARDAAARLALLHSLRAWAAQHGLSSVHLLFLDDTEQAAAQQAGWMLRHGVQFHWTQSAQQPWPSFEAFLASLQRDKRKKIQQERRRVHDAGVSLRCAEGRDIRDADWDFFYRCYQHTYRAHRSTPYLTRDFFRRMAADLPQHWLLFIAEQAGEPVAASLLAIDRQQGVAWGRYWGALVPISCLHFEACYYQPLAWCIAQGFVRFEGGAQGEHKIARGLLPTPTASAHWLAHPQFARAVEDFLQREGQGMAHYIDELREHTPFKTAAPTP